jgi:RNA polymerase sigma factor (TIGR02999 family)
MDSHATSEHDRLVRDVVTTVSAQEAKSAADLLPLVYDELRRLARSRLARLHPGQTLQATALVHEAWIRLIGEEDPGWDCRAHFFGAAAQAMRNILVEQHRRKKSLKRGGDRARVSDLDELEPEIDPPAYDFLALDEALKRLEAKYPAKSQIVMLRFFTGLSMPEVAEVLGLPLTRVEREWRFTRALLQREVGGLDLQT